MNAFGGMVTGVWVNTNGKPRVIVETEDGRAYILKCKPVVKSLDTDAIDRAKKGGGQDDNASSQAQ